MEQCRPKYTVFSSLQDEPILDYVREHLKDIREGWEHLQIAGGDGLHLTITLRRETDQPVRTDQLIRNRRSFHNKGTVEAEPLPHQKE